MASNPPLGPFQLAERVGTSVWLAEDTRSGRRVAVKLLTRTLPKDPARRDALIRDIRVAAALYHPFLVPILEIAQEGDNLLMVMDVVDGKALTRRLRATPLEKAELFRYAYQLASAVKYLHTKGLLHGNLNGDSAMITADGQVRLGGLNMGNLLRREKASKEFQVKGSDLRTVSYLAPEMISAQTIDERSDVFSYGVVLYEMATGKLPFAGSQAPDVARAIVEGQPASPKAAHPQIDNAVVGLLGGCLFKDPFKRQKEMKLIVEAIAKLDPEAVEIAAQIEKRGTAAAPAPVVQRRGILYVAEVANYDALAEQDAALASKAAAKMQQVLGESVYLFDGKVLDPFGPRMIAEMPSVESALEAGRKGEFDFSSEQQDADRVDVHMLLHAGAIEMREGMPAGAGVEKAIETLPHLALNQLFISEEFVKEGRGNVRLRDFGARAGMKLYTILQPEAAAVTITEVDPSTEEIAADLAAEVAAEAALQKAAKKKNRGLSAALAAIVVIILILGGVAAMVLRRSMRPAEAESSTAPAVAGRPTAANPRTIHLAPFTVEGIDATLPGRASAVHLAAEEILRSYPELRLSPAAVAGTDSFSANVRIGMSGPELLPTMGVKAGTPVPLADAAAGIAAVVEWVARESEATPRPLPAANVLNPFADAVAARAAGDDAATETSLRTALAADPSFLPAQLVAMRFFEKTRNLEDSLAAARQVAVLDPSNVEALRKVARAALANGNLEESFTWFGKVLEREPDDVESLNHVARYAASITDSARFTATLQRLARAKPIQVTAHEPDILTASGRIDAAIQRYYTIEETIPNSPSLALKIGRLAVLRHSLPIAEIELKKLEQSDPLYGHPMLSAYMAAEKQDRTTALGALDRALSAAVPGDDSWTSAAEVHAILADTPGVLASLEKAAQRKEPTAAYVLSHPLFRYLENDSRFQTIRETLAAQQAETRTALARVK